MLLLYMERDHGDFGFSLSDKKSQTSRKVIIKNNRIKKIKCWTNEVPGKNILVVVVELILDCGYMTKHSIEK